MLVSVVGSTSCRRVAEPKATSVTNGLFCPNHQGYVQEGATLGARNDLGIPGPMVHEVDRNNVQHGVR